MDRLFIHAINVHQGGGAVLLSDLLSAIPSDIPAVAMLDERMIVQGGIPEHVRVVRVKPSIIWRLLAEISLLRQVERDDRVLCFGNLPPLFRLRGDVSVFIQNRYLVDEHAPLVAMPPKTRIRLLIEKVWLRRCRVNAKLFFVQTPSMQILVERCLGVRAVCLPFVPANVGRLVSAPADVTLPRFDFIYVASGEAHKNHSTLINAWGILANVGVFPSLALTLSVESAPELTKWVEDEIVSKGLQVHNLGLLPHDQLIALYRNSGALIYPSTFESFGLPLIEAKLAGLPVLASELDYVRDIVDPEESFDPDSPISIARAVMRFLQGRKKLIEVVGVKTFLERVMLGKAS